MKLFRRCVGVALAGTLAFSVVPTAFANPSAGANLPKEKVGVFNPYYLLAREENDIKQKLEAANPGAQVLFQEGSGSVVLDFGGGRQDELNVLDLIKYKHDNGSLADFVELPTMTNGGYDIGKTPTSLSFFRGDSAGDTRFTVKLYNFQAKDLRGDTSQKSKHDGIDFKVSQKTKAGTPVWVNNISALEKNADETPVIDVAGAPKGLHLQTKVGSKGQLKIKPADATPYPSWDFKMEGPIALDADTGVHNVTYTVYRAGSNKADKRVGSMKIDIKALADKYEPTVDDQQNSQTKPVELEEAALSVDQIRNMVTFKAKNKPSESVYKKQGLGLPDGAKFEIGSVDPSKPGEAQQVEVKVVYKDNQVNSAGQDDSIDTFKVWVRVKAMNIRYKVENPVKTKVNDLQKVSDEEAKLVEKAIREANKHWPENVGVSVDNTGAATITFPDKTTARLEPVDTVEQKTNAERFGVNKPELTEVVDPAALSGDEQKLVEGAVRGANKQWPADTKVVVGVDGSVVVTFPDSSTAKLSPSETVAKASGDSAVGQVPSQKEEGKTKHAGKRSRQLPKTGAESPFMVLAFGMLVSSGIAVSVLARRRSNS